MPDSALVSGNRKLKHFYERPDIPMLFDLTTDEGEVTNMAASSPAEHHDLYDGMTEDFTAVVA